MELYTLDSTFLKRRSIDTFISLIWNERYAAPGDVVLEIDASQDMISELIKGTFLAINGSKEVMIIDTVSIENEILKVTGSSLLQFLNQRMLYSLRFDYPGSDRQFYSSGRTPGRVIVDIVYDMVINPTNSEKIGGIKNKITNLSIGSYDNSGPIITIAVPFGQLLDVLRPIAEAYSLGMSLYLDSASVGSYSLKFKTYKGLDRTTTQNVNGFVRFSPVFNSLTNISELDSNSGYKNVAYAFPPVLGKTVPMLDPGFASADPGDTTLGFDRRAIMIVVDGITEDMVIDTPTDVNDLLDQKAADALANNNFTKVIDGEVVPQSQYQFGTDYNLGDIVELQGYSNLVQNARITEYIRSQDVSGERAYPTVSVI